MSQSMPDLGANPLHSPRRCTCHLNPEQDTYGDVIERSPRSNDDIQHDAQILTQTALSTELSTMKTYMKLKTRKQIRGSWLRQKIRTAHYHVFQRFRYPSTGDRMCYTIDIEVLVGDSYILYAAKAVADTGCSKNLMCRTLASKLGIEFSAHMSKAILHTLGTDKFRSLGQTHHRWRCQTGRKFYEGVWEVSDKEEEFEVIIGRDTMIHNKLFKLSPDLR